MSFLKSAVLAVGMMSLVACGGSSDTGSTTPAADPCSEADPCAEDPCAEDPCAADACAADVCAEAGDACAGDACAAGDE